MCYFSQNISLLEKETAIFLLPNVFMVDIMAIKQINCSIPKPF